MRDQPSYLKVRSDCVYYTTNAHLARAVCVVRAARFIEIYRLNDAQDLARKDILRKSLEPQQRGLEVVLQWD